MYAIMHAFSNVRYWCLVNNVACILWLRSSKDSYQYLVLKMLLFLSVLYACQINVFKIIYVYLSQSTWLQPISAVYYTAIINMH